MKKILGLLLVVLFFYNVAYADPNSNTSTNSNTNTNTNNSSSSSSSSSTIKTIKLKNGAVTTKKLRNGAVTSKKIRNKTIKLEDLSPSVISKIAKGSKGAKGETGAKGVKGNKGQTGEDGPRGLTGLKGEQGRSGMNGYQGQKGDKGDKGEKGDPGYSGQASLPDISGSWEYTATVTKNPCDGKLYVNKGSFKFIQSKGSPFAIFKGNFERNIYYHPPKIDKWTGSCSVSVDELNCIYHLHNTRGGNFSLNINGGNMKGKGSVHQAKTNYTYCSVNFDMQLDKSITTKNNLK